MGIKSWVEASTRGFLTPAGAFISPKDWEKLPPLRAYSRGF